MKLVQNISWNFFFKVLGGATPIFLLFFVLDTLTVAESAQYLIFVSGIKYVQIFDLSISASITRKLAFVTKRHGLNLQDDWIVILKLLFFLSTLGILASFAGLVYLKVGLNLAVAGELWILMSLYIILEFISKLFKIHWSLVLMPYLMNAAALAANVFLIIIFWCGMVNDLKTALSAFLFINTLSLILMIFYIFSIWIKAEKRSQNVQTISVKEIVCESSITSLVSVGNIIFRASIIWMIALIDDHPSQIFYTVLFQFINYASAALNFSAPLSTALFAQGKNDKISSSNERSFLLLWNATIATTGFSVSFILIFIEVAPLYIPDIGKYGFGIQNLLMVAPSAIPIIFIAPTINLFRNTLLAHKYISQTSICEFSILFIGSCFLYLRVIEPNVIFSYVVSIYLVRVLALMGLFVNFKSSAFAFPSFLMAMISFFVCAGVFISQSFGDHDAYLYIVFFCSLACVLNLIFRGGLR